MDGSLKSWISSDDYTTGDRLWALAQTCHGLSWVYSRGIEGHGDLKPDNILFRDLYRNLAEEHRHRVPQWEIRVADFGWADIWLDREGPEYAKKAFRPYLAPERMNGDFVPEASDAFAIGVIAVELLTGQHPAGAETARVQGWKNNKYRKWANDGERHLPNVPADLHALVAACLDPDPHSRPTMKEMGRHICRSLQNHRGFEMAHATLQAWHEAASMQADDLRGARWTEQQLAKLSPRARHELINTLLGEVAVSPLPGSQEALAKWFTAATSLCVVLPERDAVGDVDTAAGVALRILKLVVHNSDADLRRQLNWDAGMDRPIISDLEPLEVFLDFVVVAQRTLRRANRLGDSEAQSLLSAFSDRWVEAHSVEDFIARLGGSPDP
jgi:serine/threonine protein kinase